MALNLAGVDHTGSPATTQRGRGDASISTASVDIGLLAQRRRALLLRHHAPPDPTRSLRFRRPFAERDHTLHRLPQQRLSTVRMDHFRQSDHEGLRLADWLVEVI